MSAAVMFPLPPFPSGTDDDEKRERKRKCVVQYFMTSHEKVRQQPEKGVRGGEGRGAVINCRRRRQNNRTYRFLAWWSQEKAYCTKGGRGLHSHCYALVLRRRLRLPLRRRDRLSFPPSLPSPNRLPHFGGRDSFGSFSLFSPDRQDRGTEEEEEE